MKVLISIVLVLITLTGSYAQGKKLRREEKRQIETQPPVRDASGISETAESSVETIANNVVYNPADHKLELMLSRPLTLHAGDYFFGERQQEAQRRFLEKLNHVDPEDNVPLNPTVNEFRNPTLEGIGTIADEPIFVNSTSKANLPYQFQFSAHQAYPMGIDNISADIFERPTVTMDRSHSMFPPDETYKIKTIPPPERQNSFSGPDFRLQTKPLSLYPKQSMHRRSQE